MSHSYIFTFNLDFTSPQAIRYVNVDLLLLVVLDPVKLIRLRWTSVGFSSNCV